MNKILAPFQVYGAKFLREGVGGLLADETGLGKTCQAIRAAGFETYLDPVLVVAPAAVLRHWRDEIHAICGTSEAVYILGGTPKQREDFLRYESKSYDWVLVSWDVLPLHSKKAHWPKARQSTRTTQYTGLTDNSWGAVILDEAHRLKNPRSLTTRSAWQLAKTTDTRIALTATPVSNDRREVWSILRFLDQPRFASRTRFANRFLNQTVEHNRTKFEGIRADRQEEYDKMVEPYILKRTAKSVGAQMPEMTITYRWVQMGPEQAKAYKSLTKRGLYRVGEKVTVTSEPLNRWAEALRLASYVPGGSETPSKVKAFWEYFEALPTGAKCVVFVENVELASIVADGANERLGREGYSILGGAAPDEVDPGKEIECFMDPDGGRELLISSYGAGAEGLNLGAAAYLVILQQTADFLKLHQAVNRIKRYDSPHEKCFVTVFGSEDTIEEQVCDLIEMKQEMVEEMVKVYQAGLLSRSA